MKKIIVTSSLLFVLVACSSPAQPSLTAISTAPFTTVPARTVTLAPTNTELPLVATPDAHTSSTPDDQHTSAWNGIPIMPGALTGEGDEESYVFAIRATPQQIEEYYRAELGKTGWQLLEEGNQDPSLLTFVDPTSATLTVNILTKGDEALVLLVK